MPHGNTGFLKDGLVTGIFVILHRKNCHKYFRNKVDMY